MTFSTRTPLRLVQTAATAAGSALPATNAGESDADQAGSTTSFGQSVVATGAAGGLVSGIGRGRLHLLTERGMATAEYAVGLIAACAFAGVLYKLVTSSAIYGLLNKLAEAALRVIG